MENITTPPAHTPGPWSYSLLDPAFASGNEMFRIDGTSDFPSVADVFFRNSDAEAEANARLIAAAPALLERCKMSLADAEAIVALPARADNFNWESIADDLRAVIDRAEGR